MIDKRTVKQIDKELPQIKMNDLIKSNQKTQSISS